MVLAGPQLYEVGYHLVPTVAEDELDAKVGAIRDAINKAHGSIVSEGMPKRITLAYVIVRRVGGKRLKYDTSHFGWIRFEAEPVGMPAFEKELAALEPMLRFLVVAVPREEFVAAKPHSLLKKAARPKETIEVSTLSSQEAIDKEIEKLVTE